MRFRKSGVDHDCIVVAAECRIQFPERLQCGPAITVSGRTGAIDRKRFVNPCGRQAWITRLERDQTEQVQGIGVTRLVFEDVLA
jgi:hypothetical protein